MPCYKPISGWRPRPGAASRKLVFNPRFALLDHPVTIPCGQCIGCRLERSRQWAVRCIHEASLHEANCFITLTYAPEHLPASGSLVLKDFQDFMKRLRKRFGSGIRFFHCGEYGDKFSRPHYHACLFNFDFPDRVLFKDGPSKLFVSESLQALWPFGFSTIGDVTFESAAYVARYVTKKITGISAEAHYSGRKPEYTTMSRRPGIGRGWYDKYKGDCYPFDELVVRDGQIMKPPKAYDRYYEFDNPLAMSKVKLSRITKAKAKALLEPYYRLAAREEFQEVAFAKLKRSFESEI